VSVLVAYAHTTEGEAALQYGHDVAGKEALPLIVFDLDSTSTADDRSIEPHHVPDTFSRTAHPELRWLARHHLNPDAADDLLDTVHELNARLIVVGVRRRSPVGKLLLGSNAQTIIIGASVPVLAVKADHHAL
jgi:hypothetical protein